MKIFHSFFFSLFLHLLILYLLLFHFSFKVQPPFLLAQQKNQLVNSYLMSYQVTKPISDLEKTSTHSMLKMHTKKVAKDGTEKKQYQIKKNLKASPSTSHSVNNKNNDLLILLHDAIQKVQRYPTSALELGRTGKATISFILYINGTISDVNLIHSSGTESLDKAALEAILKAVPFPHVANYLKKPQQFNIDISFEI